jgi:hypothetical protein
MPDEMTGEVGECNSHRVKPVQNGIDLRPYSPYIGLVRHLVRHLEDIAHHDLIVDQVARPECC